MPDRLPRLPRCEYQGKAWVHWTMSMRDRSTGWLDDSMHMELRQLLLHAMGRYDLHCPVYCIMPDHAHFLWLGIRNDSDQWLAARFLRRFWNQKLADYGCKLQPQAHDRVLRQAESHPQEFEDAAYYIFENPQRAGLVEDWKSWPYLGAMVPGYPDLSVRDGSSYLRSFWNIHNRTTTRHKT